MRILNLPEDFKMDYNVFFPDKQDDKKKYKEIYKKKQPKKY